MSFITTEKNPELFKSRKDSKQIKQLVQKVSKAIDVLNAAQEEADKHKEALRALAKTQYWASNFDVHPPRHTFDVDNTLQLNFFNRYHLTKEIKNQISELFVESKHITDKLINEQTVNVDVTSLSEEQKVEFYKEQSALCKKYNLQGYMDEKYKVSEVFHDTRHLLMPSVNTYIDKVMPLQVHITQIK